MVRLLFKSKLFWRTPAWLSAIAGSIMVFVAAIALLPLKLPADNDYSTVVLDENGEVLRAFAAENGVWRQKISLTNVSESYVEALIHYEDRYFWRHPGVNPLSVLRASWQNLRCGCVVSGGSTLTMQIARVLYPHSKTFRGKAYQVFRALQLEWHLSKQDILTLYLNHAPFGGTLEGVAAASMAYYKRDPAHLSDSEAAVLAILPQAPSYYRPDRYPDRAEAARDKLIERLVSLGVWSEERADNAKLESVEAYKPQWPIDAPLFARWVKPIVSSNQITTVNSALQQTLQAYANNYVRTIDVSTSMAILVIENASNELKAYIGSASFFDEYRQGHVDMVQALRSPGSTLKPFIYAMAMDEGLIHSYSLLSDVPRTRKSYRPDNFDGTYSGPVSVTEALQRSLNIPAVQVTEVLGAEKLVNRLQTADINITLPQYANKNSSVALGGAGVSLWDLLTAYSALANEGAVTPIIWRQPQLQPARTQIMSKEAAWISYQMLRSAQPPNHSQRAFFAKPKNNIAWKTGTSYGFRDAWAIGLSRDYTIGVWVGNPSSAPQPGLFGANTAAPALFDVFDIVDPKPQPLPKPEGVIARKVCWPNGQTITPDTSSCEHIETALTIGGVTPPTLAQPINKQLDVVFWSNVTGTQRTEPNCDKAAVKKRVHLWPVELEPWLASSLRRDSLIPPDDPSCRSLVPIRHTGLQIVGLEHESRFVSLRAGAVNPIVSLVAIGGAGVRNWYVNEQFVGQTHEHYGIEYELKDLGEHYVFVIDEQGNSDDIVIYKDSS